uniref:Uncharacterized protein n=1 Tax=Amphimedon queenslandica TaxID=400682 RepID=A0A1X7SRF7_AMPQE
MENKTMSTSFQSEAKDFNKEMKLTQNTAYEPVVKTDTSTEEAMYLDLLDYSDYQLPKANVKDRIIVLLDFRNGSNGIRRCRREGDSAGCRSNIFQTNGISYSQICGKVVGYQKGSTDAGYANINDINDAYIDGVSITRGSPRRHVWSYIAGLRSKINGVSTCPCNNGTTNTIQSFVGEHYYCESGTNSELSNTKVYTTDPLWDGNNCPSVEASCCNGTGLMWFFRDYGNATITDYIELRVCGIAGWGNEDTPVQLYEIYVK